MGYINGTHALQLFRTEFDNSENKLENAKIVKLLGTFIEEENLTIHRKINTFIANLDPVQLYYGWDGEIYPKFHTKSITLS